MTIACQPPTHDRTSFSCRPTRCSLSAAKLSSRFVHIRTSGRDRAEQVDTITEQPCSHEFTPHPHPIAFIVPGGHLVLSMPHTVADLHNSEERMMGQGQGIDDGPHHPVMATGARAVLAKWRLWGSKGTMGQHGATWDTWGLWLAPGALYPPDELWPRPATGPVPSPDRS